MNELTIFEKEEFGKLRTVTVDNEPWFVASDVCNALEISNTTMALQRLDADERSKFNLGRQGETNCVNEYGLYRLVLASKKKKAHNFKRWITHEVIPSIRKTGGYIAGQEAMSDDELMAKALLVAQRQIEERNKLIETMRPKALFADAVSTSETTILVRELAKLLKQNGVEIGQKRLFSWLRDNGYLIKRGSDCNMPTQRAMEMKLFEIKETTIHVPDDSVRISKTVKVTGKGQLYFINKFLGGEDR